MIDWKFMLEQHGWKKGDDNMWFDTNNSRTLLDPRAALRRMQKGLSSDHPFQKVDVSRIMIFNGEKPTKMKKHGRIGVLDEKMIASYNSIYQKHKLGKG